MNNYPYNPYGNQGQQYNPYQQQQPWYGNNSVADDRATHQSLLSKVLMMLSFSLVMAGFGMFAGLQLLSAGIGVFLLPAIILEFVVLIALVSVALFSGFIVYDIQRIKFTEDTMSAAILLTISIYLDILNLFLSLLHLLGGSDDRS